MTKLNVKATFSNKTVKITDVFLYTYRRGMGKKHNLRVLQQTRMNLRNGAWVADVNTPAVDIKKYKIILRVIAYDKDGNAVASVARADRKHPP
jgi:hypothetical protein